MGGARRIFFASEHRPNFSRGNVFSAAEAGLSTPSRGAHKPQAVPLPNLFLFEDRCEKSVAGMDARNCPQIRTAGKRGRIGTE